MDSWAVSPQLLSPGITRPLTLMGMSKHILIPATLTLLLASCGGTPSATTPPPGGGGNTTTIDHRAARGHLSTLTLPLDETLASDPSVGGSVQVLQAEGQKPSTKGTRSGKTVTFDLKTVPVPQTLQAPAESLNYGFVSLKTCNRTTRLTPGAQLNIGSGEFNITRPSGSTYADLRSETRSEGDTADTTHTRGLTLVYSKNRMRIQGEAACTGDLGGVKARTQQNLDVQLEVGWNLLRYEATGVFSHNGDHKPTGLDLKVTLEDSADTSGVTLH